MILDTSFIIDLLNDEESAVKKAQEIDRSNAPISTTAVSVFEIWQGIADIKNEKKLERINNLLESIGLFNLDQESAKIGGRVHAELYARGTPIQPEDSMIAGICLKHSKKVLTRNVKHFSRISGLEIETY